MSENDVPPPELDVLGHLDPEDVFAIADAARRQAELQVLGRRLKADLDRIVDRALPYERAELEARAAAFVAAWDQYAAGERERYGLRRLIRQRGLIP